VVGRSTERRHYFEGKQIWPILKVPSQCSLFLLVEVCWKEGKALGNEGGKALGSGHLRLSAQERNLLRYFLRSELRRQCWQDRITAKFMLTFDFSVDLILSASLWP
jgi:hypothetical protein